ncbi:polysaccharide deacetylase family protein [Methylobacterium sp. Leaf118]|uniref:polysaccharide deacetylase family protein n=1 Tax=Methylobacterium sp. Leaf118 TaxID=2876562 RepID=UPI001E56B2CB|nr:polysaccharide deacetylase family protein [Methylobacterium sp. Leaf118]
MRPLQWLLLTSWILVPNSVVAAQECSPDALGTSRIMEVPFTQGPVGRTNYRRTLPLAPGEVVLTFDDGPMPRRTPAVLDALRAECVKATFFVVGTMVAAFPDILRRTAAEGHTIATHTWSHAYLDKTRSEVVQRDQISGGLLAARAVLGDNNPNLSSFFRYPGLGHTQALDRYVGEQHLIPFSIDVDGEDWKRITPAQVVDRVMGRLDNLGRGIILLHDIQARTVAILPELLRQLKANGYRVVHITGVAEDTRQALNTSEPPRSERIQVALGRLNQQQGIRLATRESEPDRSPRSVAAADSRNLVGRPSRVQVASAELDGSEMTAQAVRGHTPAPRPAVLRGSLDLPMIAARTVIEPVVAPATGRGHDGPPGLAAGSDVSASIGAVRSQSATMQSEQPPLPLQRKEQPETRPPANAPMVRISATWVDPPVRMAASLSGSSANPPTSSAAKVASEMPPSKLALNASLTPVIVSSLDAGASTPASKSAPVKVAALETQQTAPANLHKIRASENTHIATQRPAAVTPSSTTSAVPRGVTPDPSLTTGSVPAAIDRPPSASLTNPAPQPISSSPIAKPEAVIGIAQAVTGLPATRLAPPPAAASPAAGQRHSGFVVLAVASGAGPNFQEITMQR